MLDKGRREGEGLLCVTRNEQNQEVPFTQWNQRADMDPKAGNMAQECSTPVPKQE